MLTYWFPEPVSFWWPLAFAIIFAVVGIVAVFATLARREREFDASTIALLYGIGFGVIAVSEFLMFLGAAFHWSLPTVFSFSGVIATALVILAALIALVSLAGAMAIQRREERVYRMFHPAH